MYSLTDPDLLKLLIHKSQEGLEVSIFYDKSASSNLSKKLPPTIHTYPIQTSGLMHRKILIVDETLVFIGSANWTPTSLKMHDNLVLGLFHQELAAHLSKSKAPSFAFELEGQHAELWLLPDVEDKALNRLINLLDTAQKTIRIAMFTFTHPKLTEALIQAKKREVSVTVVIDRYTGQGSSEKALERLKQADVEVQLNIGTQLLHHKWAYIDEKILVQGSANWTLAAFSKNEDCFMILQDLSTKQRKFLNELWHIIYQDSK